MEKAKTAGRVEIIRETSEYLVVYKPAGLAVESRSVTQPDLESLLKKDRPALFVINRLDQVVEGLVLFAKTKPAAADFSKQMQAHRMTKEYLAVVDGAPEPQKASGTDKSSGMAEGRKQNPETARTEPAEQTLRDFLLKDGRTNTSRVVPAGTKGAKEAVLTFSCVESREEKSLLRIQLLTGRHHQIRVQLAHANLPICGDRKYNPRENEKGPAGSCREGAERQTPGSGIGFPALCACGLTFTDPKNGQNVSCRITPRGERFRVFADELRFP